MRSHHALVDDATVRVGSLLVGDGGDVAVSTVDGRGTFTEFELED
jgi:hypothetical protein